MLWHLVVLIYICGEVRKKGCKWVCPFERKGNCKKGCLNHNSKDMQGFSTQGRCRLGHKCIAAILTLREAR